jgi:anti-sigma regulatory factor (Ser/Thr protein kinase)
MTEGSVDEAQEWLSVIAHGVQPRDHRAPVVPADSRATSVGLPAVPESVKEARDFTRTALCGWGMSAINDEVRLVVSELVTNAMRYGAGLTNTGGDLPIRLSLLRTGDRLTCAVTDPSDQIPVHRQPDSASQNGRGLHLVEAFSDSWDWVPLPGHGKVVWACFRCHG